MRQLFSWLLCAATALCLAPSAQAQVTTYTNQASFLAALNPGFYLETFNTLPPPQPVASPLNFSQGSFSYSVAAGPNSGFFTAGTAGDIWLSTDFAVDSMTWTFNGGNINAVGGFFFTSDISGASQVGNIFISTDQTAQQTLLATTPSTFLGFISSTPFTTLTLSADQAGGPIWSTANDFIVGVAAAVPEPTTIALIALGGVGAVGAWYRQRRRRQQLLSSDLRVSRRA